MGRMSICQLILKPFWCFALLLRVHNISCHISVCAVCCRFSFSIFTFPIFWFSLARFRCSRFRHARTQLVKWKMSWQLFIIPICCELFFLNIRTYNSFYRLWYRHRHHYKHISSAHMRTHTHIHHVSYLCERRSTQVFFSIHFGCLLDETIHRMCVCVNVDFPCISLAFLQKSCHFFNDCEGDEVACICSGYC